MTGASPAPQAFAARFLQLMGDAGWRIVLHVLPYALAAGAITEAAVRLRLSLAWRLPLVLLLLATLHLAVLLGAHVATLRLALRRGVEPAPIRHLFSMAGRISLESATIAVVCLVAALALVGALDLVVLGVQPTGAARWPSMLLQAIVTFAMLSMMIVLLAGGTALSASTFGQPVGFAAAARHLFHRSERTTGVICTAILAGTVAVFLGTRLSGAAELGPVIIAAVLAKAGGYLAATVPLSVGAAAIASDP